MSKLEVTDNICPFESPRIWHQEIWFFKSRSIRETKKFSQKNKQWGKVSIRVMVKKVETEKQNIVLTQTMVR